MSQATPLLVLSMAICMVTLMRACFYDKMKEWGFAISSNEINVDENLPNFFNAVKLSDAEWFIKESRYCREQYKFSFANKAVVDKLDSLKNVPKKPITNLVWYNLLSNPVYAEAFNYFTVSTPDREKFIVDDDSDEENDCEQSDMVCLLVNLAYVRAIVAKKFEFKQGYSKEFSVNMKRAGTIHLGTKEAKAEE